MAKRVNYGFGKRQKEIKRQKKKDEKAEKKRIKKEAANGGEQGETTPSADEPSSSVHDVLPGPTR